MSSIASLFAAVGLLAGVGLSVYSFFTVQQYDTSTVSISVAVYGMATYYAVLAVACFVFSGVCILVSRRAKPVSS
jgi:hypothetical protein